MIDPTRLYLTYKSGIYATLAIGVNIRKEGEQASTHGELTYFDTNRGRTFTGTLAAENTAGFSFLTEQGETLEFKIATRKLFDKEARPTVEGPIPAFQYEQDLSEFYRRRFLQT